MVATTAAMAPAPATTSRTATRASGPDRTTVMMLSVAAFLAILAVLAWQMRSAPARPARRVVLVRRVSEARRRDSRRAQGRRQFGDSVGLEQRPGVVARTGHPVIVSPARPGLMSQQLDYTFHAMGSDVRLLIGPRLQRAAPAPLAAADRERAFVLEYAPALALSARHELSALNRDPRTSVPASQLLQAAVRAGLWAAERSDGLIEPTLVDALERAGYTYSRDGAAPASLRDALDAAPARRPARPDKRSRWREIAVDDEAGTIIRPPGVLLDTGGTGKGLCADAVAHRLRGYARFLVDCGRGGVATSGLSVRIWRRADGSYAHHLLDPSTGQPAWTGLIGVTALGATALEAETLSKLALLSGPNGARRVLGEYGGVIIHDNGGVEAAGPLEGRVSAPAGLLVAS